MLRVLHNLCHLIFSKIWRLSLGQFSQMLLHIRNTWELYKITTPRKAPQNHSIESLGMRPRHWVSPGDFKAQPSLRIKVSGLIILILQWCWHPKKKMNLPKGTQLLNGKTVIQTWVCLSPNASHSLFHYAIFSPEVCCLWLSHSYLVASLWTWAKGNSLKGYQELLDSKGFLRTGLRQKESWHFWLLHKCLAEMASHHVQSLCPFGQDSISRVEAPSGSDFGAWAPLLTRVE